MGGLLLPFHSSLLRDGDQLPRGMAGGSGLRGDGAAAGKLRYGRTLRVGTALLRRPLPREPHVHAACVHIYTLLQGLPPSLRACITVRTLLRCPWESTVSLAWFCGGFLLWELFLVSAGCGFALTMSCLLIGCFGIAHKPLRHVPRELSVFQTI